MHTPGPWKVKRTPQGFRIIWMNPAFPSVLAQCFDPSDGRPNVGTAEANAILMAATPDLLAACERLVNAYQKDRRSQLGAIVQGRAALAKATEGKP
jgi:hypothetical protein